MKIGNVEIINNVMLAPLAGYSDIGFRAICRLYGAGMTTTEMVSSAALFYRNEKTEVLMEIMPDEHPCAVQLFGHDPATMAAACRHKTLDKFDIIDINCGCPVKKIVKNGEGSALLKNVKLAQEIVRACVENSNNRPVTVKMRIGFEKENLTGVDFAKAMEDAGASAICVHGRTREQFYEGVANWDYIAKVVEAVKIPVIANGDVDCKKAFEDIIKTTNCAGVMIGRGAIGNPQIFAEILGLNIERTLYENIKLHIDILKTVYPQLQVCQEMKGHICSYVKGMRDCNILRRDICACASLEAMEQVIEEKFGKI
ncbi:MAG: tRNA dihydrouridine synthase DusB [Clostridia bacterium]